MGCGFSSWSLKTNQILGAIWPRRVVLRDRNDLKFLTGCAGFIPDRFADQKPCDRGYEGNRTGLGVGFVLSHDAIFLYAPIAAPESHRAAKGDNVGRRRTVDDVSRADTH